MKVLLILIVIGALGTVTKILVLGLLDLEISWDHPNYSIVEISQNTKKSPGDLKRLVVTQTPAEKYQLTVVQRTHEWVNNNNNNTKLSTLLSQLTTE